MSVFKEEIHQDEVASSCVKRLMQDAELKESRVVESVKIAPQQVAVMLKSKVRADRAPIRRHVMAALFPRQPSCHTPGRAPM